MILENIPFENFASFYFVKKLGASQFFRNFSEIQLGRIENSSETCRLSLLFQKLLFLLSIFANRYVIEEVEIEDGINSKKQVTHF